jgi:hypothetical protein
VPDELVHSHIHRVRPGGKEQTGVPLQTRQLFRCAVFVNGLGHDGLKISPKHQARLLLPVHPLRVLRIGFPRNGASNDKKSGKKQGNQLAKVETGQHLHTQVGNGNQPFTEKAACLKS